MKKIITITTILFAPVALLAQDVVRLPGGQVFDRNILNELLTILVLYLVISFILAIIRSIQEYRLKLKMMEKGVSDKIVEQFLKPDSKDAGSVAMKWFLILTGIALGLGVVAASLPAGVHSVAIMAFSLGLSFLGYYYFIKRSGK